MMKASEFKWCEVLPESPSPLIELEEKDPVLEALVKVVQATDQRLF